MTDKRLEAAAQMRRRAGSDDPAVVRRYYHEALEAAIKEAKLVREAAERSRSPRKPSAA